MTDDKQKLAAKNMLDTYLKAHRLRRTPERYVVLDKVSEATRPFGVDEIMQAVAEEGFLLSRTTVYSTLALFVKCGIARMHRFGTCRSAKYERASIADGLIHLICSQCGKVKEVKDPALMASVNNRSYSAFHPAHSCLYVYGTCSTCSRKNRKTRKSEKTTHNTNKKK